MPFTDTTACRAVAAALLATSALALTTACHEISGNRTGNPAGVSPAPSSSSREDGENPSPDPDGRVACTPEMLRFHAGCHAAADPPHAADGHQLLRPDLPLRRPALPPAAVRRRPAAHPPRDRGEPASSTVVSLAPGDTAYATITTSAAAWAGRQGPPGPENLPVRRRTDRPRHPHPGRSGRPRPGPCRPAHRHGHVLAAEPGRRPEVVTIRPRHAAGTRRAVVRSGRIRPYPSGLPSPMIQICRQ